jgi:hypothetical protein
MKKPFILFVLLAIILAAAFWYVNNRDNNPTASLESEAFYLCEDGKTIKAAVYNNKAEVELSDGRILSLPLADTSFGKKYASKDDSVAFWYEGNGALILENNIDQTYTGCVRLAMEPSEFPEAYTDGQNGFSLRYPGGYTVNNSYKYESLGPNREIYGVKFTIPSSYATGKNLSSFDTGVSLEIVPAVQECTASLFLDDVEAQDTTEGGREYSYAEMSGAGAGNRYDEYVWALKGTNPCIAVRYLIHSTNIGNYPEGTVEEFDKESLIGEFDKIRESLITI